MTRCGPGASPGQAVLAALADTGEGAGPRGAGGGLAGLMIRRAGAGPSGAGGRWSAAMPVQPATATGTRDTLLGRGRRLPVAATGPRSASQALETGKPGCLMVVADLLAGRVRAKRRCCFCSASRGLHRGYWAFTLTTRAACDRASASRPDGRYPGHRPRRRALLRQYQEAPPPADAGAAEPAWHRRGRPDLPAMTRLPDGDLLTNAALALVRGNRTRGRTWMRFCCGPCRVMS